VLIVTKLFPNAVEPTAVPFNRHLFSELAKQCDVTLLATIPWFPAASVLGDRCGAGRLAAVPNEEWIDGLRVHHPRVLLVPRIGHRVAGPLYAASLLARIVRMRGAVDVVLGSWAYPDGMAAVLLARALDVPAVIKVHGSDINVLSKTPAICPSLRWTLRHAAAVVSPSPALAERAVELGASSDGVRVIRNGVDHEKFYVRDRTQARLTLGLDPRGKWIVYVGRIERAKGVEQLAQAFRLLARAHDDAKLVWVGDGSARSVCEELRSSLPRQVICAGVRTHDEIPLWLSAADVVTLPSWNEGLPNTILEALASGRRVVATRVGGIPSVVDSELLGELVSPGKPDELRAALVRALHTAYDPQLVAAAVRLPSWSDSAAALRDVMNTAVQAFRARDLRMVGRVPIRNP
jgi:glycosyltransferase involved in cell wall biosynthesis